MWNAKEHRHLAQVLPALRSMTGPRTGGTPQERNSGRWLETLQVRSFLSPFPTLDRLSGPPTALESLLLQSAPTPHALSVLYALLRDAASPGLPQCLVKWEEDLGSSFTAEAWEKSFALTHSLSVASHAQELKTAF